MSYCDEEIDHWDEVEDPEPDPRDNIFECKQCFDPVVEDEIVEYKAMYFCSGYCRDRWKAANEFDDGEDE